MGLTNRLVWGVLGVFAVAGCGRAAQVDGEGHSEGVEALAFAKSGTRLKARGYEADGAELFRSLYDSKLKFDCELVTAEDGHGLVCVPKTVVERVIYLDEKCQEPATWVWPGNLSDDAAPGTTVSAGETRPRCDEDPLPHREAFVVGERVYEQELDPSVWPSVYALQSNGQCVKSGPPAHEFPPVVRMTRIAKSELASAHTETVPVGSDLQARRFVSEDGAELTVGVAGKDGTPCALQPDGVCIPGSVAIRETPIPDDTTDGVYTALDGSCQQAAFMELGSCGDAKFGVDHTGGETRFYRLEKPAAIFQRLPDFDHLAQTEELRWVCQPSSDYVPPGVYAPGELVASTQFPAAHEVQRGEGALHVNWFAAGTTSESLLRLTNELDATFFLDADGKACEVFSASDGSLRCGSHELASEPSSMPQVFEVDL